MLMIKTKTDQWSILGNPESIPIYGNLIYDELTSKKDEQFTKRH